MGDDIEAIFNVLATLPPNHYMSKEISDRTGIPARTLSSWNNKVTQQNRVGDL
jgi:muconolactone delta-isomerase